jgi:hypothetical protein
LFFYRAKLPDDEVERARRPMNDKEIGRVWAEYYPKSRDNSDALQICGMICRLIRAESRLGFVFSRSGKLQRVLDACGISKGDFDAIEKGLFREL